MVGTVVVVMLCVRETYVAATKEESTGQYIGPEDSNITFAQRILITLSGSR
jgi:hypothetical protein